jgi:hypothetical protein
MAPGRTSSNSLARMRLVASGEKRLQVGAVSFIQFFGSAL